MKVQMRKPEETLCGCRCSPIEMSAAVAAGSERKSGVKKKSIAIVMLIILTFSAVLLLRHPVSGMVNKFFLGHQLVRMVLKEPEAVGFDMDAIQTSSNGRLTRDGYYHWESYDTWADIPFENVIKDMFFQGEISFDNEVYINLFRFHAFHKAICSSHSSTGSKHIVMN